MSEKSLIDPRKGADIVAQAHQLARIYTPGWTPRDGNPAEALVQLFSRLMEIVIDRLNRVPEKHFLAFLDAAGVTPLPPKAARAPVRFLLSKGAKEDGFVPKGTSLATDIKDQPPVTFETEQDLIAVRARIAAAFVYTPQADSYDSGAPLLQAAAMNTRHSFLPFQGNTLVPHRIYMAHDILFAVSAGTRIEISFSLDNPPGEDDFFTDKLRWFCRSKGQDRPLPALPGATAHAVVFEDVSDVAAWEFDDTRACWFWAQSIAPLTKRQSALSVAAVSCAARAGGLMPDLLFHNTAALDSTREFYPFGQRPKRYDTFFAACSEAFSKTGNRITLLLNYTAGTTTAVELHWEFWNGDSWAMLGKTTHNGVPANGNPYSFSDDTRAFTVSGQDLAIRFTCPSMQQAEINGQKGLWVRVRLMDGGYGAEAGMTLTEEGQSLPPEDLRLSHYKFSPETFAPPVITSLVISHENMAPVALQRIKTENNFIVEEHTPGSVFRPFAMPAENLPAFYLGFDSAPTPGKPVSLYLSVATASMGDAPVMTWAYWSGNSWKRLAVSDTTRNLTESGIVTFTAPTDFASDIRFTESAPRFWIRLALESGDPADFAVDAIHLNVVWAQNTVTIRNETLGSSSETPGASFKIARAPVLENQQVEVLEPEPPPAEELADLEQEEGAAVLTGAGTGTAGTAATWVRWHEVDDFRLSNPKSRHYMIDRATGRITFGSGQRGMVPPAGRDNIRARQYQSGGDARGNVPVSTITVLKRAIPLIDKVVNVEAAGGGSAMEAEAALVARGPRSLKHRERSVTWEDYEWLAKEASFQVARARCLPAAGVDRAGKVTLIIVPESEADRPFPDQGLIRQVRQHIRAAMIPTAELLIYGPKYIQVAITATVFPEQPARADFVRGLVEQRLQVFFHPLKGGPEQQGWAFGRDVHISEVCKVIEETPGVHHAEDVAVCSAFYEDGSAVLAPRASLEDYVELLEHVAVGDDYLVASGAHRIVMPGASTAFTADEALFIANTRTREIHNLNCLRTNCRVSEISEEHVKYFLCLSSALREGYDFCAWCFGRQYSLR